MKELTIQEKAKAYDEAIKRASNLHKDALETEDNWITKTCEVIFPELADSKDDKIKKAIIEHFADSHSSMYPYKGFTREQILAWLEKQGEQKPSDKVEPKFKIGDTIVEKDLNECGYGTIKDIKDGQYVFTDGSGMNINEQNGWQLVKTSTNIKQNPAWSEEDTHQLSEAIEAVNESSYSLKRKDVVID